MLISAVRPSGPLRTPPQARPTAGLMPPTSVDTVRFGQKTYPDIFSQVILTPVQQATARQIETLASARDLISLNAYLALMGNPEFRPMAKPKGRKLSHSPVTDLLLHLPPAQKEQLIERLSQAVRQASTDLARKNAVEALGDLYFYALRPGGRMRGAQKPALQARLLQTMESLIRTGSPGSAKQMRDQLRIHWLEWKIGLGLKLVTATDADKRAMARQLQPLMGYRIPPAAARPPAPAAEVQKLEQALLNPDPRLLEAMSDSGELTRLIPEWARVADPDRNTQHSTQDFSLKDHTLNAVKFTKQSPYYQGLSQAEKRLVTMAALLHDIGKETGPCNLRAIIPIDRPHPLRSEIIAREVLPTLHYNAPDIEQTAKLVRYHQFLGMMVASDLPAPPESYLQAAVSRIENVKTLTMLRALTEGDIRGVKLNSGWFTPEIEDRLRRFSNLIEQRLTPQTP